MQLYFIRHGQSENNAIWDEKSYSAARVSDPRLTEKGVLQASYLAEFLAQSRATSGDDWIDSQNCAGFKLTHLYCSFMERAIQTGSILSERLGIPLFAHPDMFEVGGIYLETLVEDQPVISTEYGLTPADLKQRYPKLQWVQPIGDQGWWQGGREDRPARMERAKKVIAYLYEQHGGTEDRVAVITHGSFFGYLFRTLFHLDLEYTGSTGSLPYGLLLNNCGITRFEISEQKATLVYHNRVDFMPCELIT